MTTTYPTKVQSSTWNDKVTYRCYYKQQNGRWAKFSEAKYSTFEEAKAELLKLQEQSPSFVYQEQ